MVAPVHRAPPPQGCDVNIIVPLYRQPALLAEALASVSAQVAPPRWRLTVVIDGCPYRQSLLTARSWAQAERGRIVVLQQYNRGLAAARNSGIRFALTAWPECRAFFFLDADNRLHPHFLRRAWEALCAAPPEIGWFYPDFDLFGLEGAWSTAGSYHLLQHMTESICDAAVMVRREVFAAGVVFDETLRSGYEDWDFFLRAAAAGFRGLHLPTAGFLYRRRPESMLREARREGKELVTALQQRHPALYAPRRVLALEEQEAPRFLLISPETTVACLDPHHPPSAASRTDLLRQLAHAMVAAGRIHAPHVVVCAAAGALASLREAGLLRCVLAHAERVLATAALCAIALSPSATGALALVPDAETTPEQAQILVFRRETLSEARHGTLSRLKWRGLAATLPAPVPPPGGALAVAAAAAAELIALEKTLPRHRPWRGEGRVPRDQAAARVARSAFHAWPLLPLSLQPDRRDIAFIVPLFGLGGVERVISCLAAALRRHGCRTHLVVSGSEKVDFPPPAAAFDSLILLPGFDCERHGGDRIAYFGAPTAVFDETSEEATALLGLLAPMQAVLNTHSFAGHAVAGRLRRLGVRTACALHLTERGRYGEPIGNPHSALAYEHAYDLVVTHSQRLARWCAAAGIPQDKLLPLANAPGYEADPTEVAAAGARRRERLGGRPLRALFLGRLDHQKGIDRLPAIVAATAGRVEWRVVGRSVLDDPPPLPLPLTPPVHEPAALDALYAWADVLVLPSRFEGVPLTVLEAQRLGCIPLATAVGGVAEAITDGEDGVLIPADAPDWAIGHAMAQALLALAADDERRWHLARGAMRRSAERSWEEAAHKLYAALFPDS